MTKELVMTCRPFGGNEARSIGFVNRVVDDDVLDAAVDELVAELLTKSTLTLRATKQGVNAVLDEMATTAHAWNDADALMNALRDPESRQAGRDYLERRGR
jgi:enoyl-CoA hydratase/carnithine racemase